MISVACASDHAYFCGLLVTLHSLCRHVRAGSSLRLHVLDTGLDDEDRDLLKKLETTFPGKSVELCLHRVDLARFASLPPWRGGHAAYARLLLPELLAGEDWTVYTDVDTLWLRDVSDLWSRRAEFPVLAAVPDGCGLPAYSSGQAMAARYAIHGRTIDPAAYFCSGLLVMNLARLRADGFSAAWPSLVAGHPDILAFADQDVYNWLYPAPATTLLAPLWGEFAAAYGLRGTSAPRVLHYAKAAPWKQKVSAVGMRWWTYLAEDVGFDRLGSRADAFRREYARRTRLFRLLRRPLLFAFAYAPAALFNRKVWSKRRAAIFPETRAAAQTSE